MKAVGESEFKKRKLIKDSLSFGWVEIRRSKETCNVNAKETPKVTINEQFERGKLMMEI